jgi:hypothetical protein
VSRRVDSHQRGRASFETPRQEARLQRAVAAQADPVGIADRRHRAEVAFIVVGGLRCP